MAGINYYMTERYSICPACGRQVKPGDVLGRNRDNGLPEFVCEPCAEYDGWGTN